MEAAKIDPDHAQKPDLEQHQKSDPEQVQKPDLEPVSQTSVDRPVVSIEERIKHQEDARRNIESMTTWFQAMQSDITKMAESVRNMKPPLDVSFFDLEPDPEPKEERFPVDLCERCERRAAEPSGSKPARGRKRVGREIE